MGKRGPQTGLSGHKRVLVPKRLTIHTDHELVKAQHFNDRIDAFLLDLTEDRPFPICALEPAIVSRVVEATETMQHAVVDGIEGFCVRKSPPNHLESAEETPFLPGSYALGRRQGR